MCTLKLLALRRPGKAMARSLSEETRVGTDRDRTYVLFSSMTYIKARKFQKALRGPLGLGLFVAFFVLSFLALAQDSTPSAEPSTLFARVIKNQEKSELLLDQYERVERVEKRRAGGPSDPVDTKFWRIFPTGTGVDKIALSSEGKPSDSDSYRSDLEKLEKYIAWVVQDGASQKDAYAKAERKRKERFELIEATNQAFRFTLEGKEPRGDQTLLRYSMEPNPDYHATSRNTVLFTKVHGIIWVDEQSFELAKVQGSVTEDFSVALFLAKVNKGSQFMQERYEVAPGLWGPTFEQYDFDGRKFMVSFSIHERTFYSDYKRVGPPGEAVEVVRTELNKLQADQPSR